MPSKKPLTKGKGKAKPEPNPPPNWPALKPLIPTSDLSLETLLPNQIVLIKNFWTGKLCKDYVSFLKTLPLVTTPGTPKRGEALRVNDRYQVFDEAFANRLWEETGLRELVCGEGEGISEEKMELWGGEPVGLNPSIRVYRYGKGQFFDKHYDETSVFNLETKPGPTPAKTTWTILLYLTSPATGCEGGETVFYPDVINIPGKKKIIEEPVVVELETGMLLLHKHGNDCMLHEGREVTDGEKWVIRTDLCVKRVKPTLVLPSFNL